MIVSHNNRLVVITSKNLTDSQIIYWLSLEDQGYITLRIN